MPSRHPIPYDTSTGACRDLRNFADALFDLVLAETKRPSFGVGTAQSDMNVRMLCVEVLLPPIRTAYPDGLKVQVTSASGLKSGSS